MLYCTLAIYTPLDDGLRGVQKYLVVLPPLVPPADFGSKSCW